SGAIADEQGKFNLNNVVLNGQRSDPDVRILRALLAAVDLSPDLSDAVLDWIDADGDLAGAGGAEDAYYLSLAKPYRAANKAMVQVEELYRVRGFDANAVAKLKPYVTALPARTPINANTASDVVMAAALGSTRAAVATLIAARQGKPFQSPATFDDLARKANLNPAANVFDVKSGYYSVRIQVDQDDVRLAADALVRRADNASTDIIWRRPRY
ncbi:MAG: type II secretion system minor pseudopilin GspK, partial [Usitatibacter sp.]